MKKPLVLIFIFFSTFTFSQNEKDIDSLNLRIFNNGKYLIKELKVNVGGNEYIFKDVGRNSYSEYAKLPYIWNANNSLTTTVIVKRMFRYDEWWTLKEYPIDHIGERKIEGGYCTLEIKTRLKKKELQVEQNLIQE